MFSRNMRPTLTTISVSISSLRTSRSKGFSFELHCELDFCSLLVSAGLDIYNFVNVYTRVHTFIFVVLSIVISVWLVSSYYHHWNKEKDGQFRRFIFGSIPMFIGAQLAILGTITYPRC